MLRGDLFHASYSWSGPSLPQDYAYTPDAQEDPKFRLGNAGNLSLISQWMVYSTTG